MKVKLDRGLGDDKFMDVLGASTVQHIQLVESDHCALLVVLKGWNTGAQGGNGGGRGNKPFRYENMW